MKLKALFADDDAVSPVIGVILMVAITVILAAVIGTFVLGLGDQVGNNAPQASFSYDFTNSTGTSADTLEIAHNGGATVDGTQLSIKASGDIASDDAGANSGASLDWTTVGTSEVTAGDSVNVYNHHGGSNADLSDDTVRVIWTSSSGDSSAELAKWTGPNA